jgi:hypothetical protein
VIRLGPDGASEQVTNGAAGVSSGRNQIPAARALVQNQDLPHGLGLCLRLRLCSGLSLCLRLAHEVDAGTSRREGAG